MSSVWWFLIIKFTFIITWFFFFFLKNDTCFRTKKVFISSRNNLELLGIKVFINLRSAKHLHAYPLLNAYSVKITLLSFFCWRRLPFFCKGGNFELQQTRWLWFFGMTDRLARLGEKFVFCRKFLTFFLIDKNHKTNRVSSVRIQGHFCLWIFSKNHSKISHG